VCSGAQRQSDGGRRSTAEIGAGHQDDAVAGIARIGFRVVSGHAKGGHLVVGIVRFTQERPANAIVYSDAAR